MERWNIYIYIYTEHATQSVSSTLHHNWRISPGPIITTCTLFPSLISISGSKKEEKCNEIKQGMHVDQMERVVHKIFKGRKKGWKIAVVYGLNAHNKKNALRNWGKNSSTKLRRVTEHSVLVCLCDTKSLTHRDGYYITPHVCAIPAGLESWLRNSSSDTFPVRSSL